MILPITLLALGAASLAAAWTLIRIRSAGRRQEARRAEAILLFGAAVLPSGPSPALRVRTRRASGLHAAGLAPLVICSGLPAEIEAMTELLRAYGVPQQAIVTEPAASTRETVARALHRLGVERPVIAVSSRYHMHRVLEEARRQGVRAFGSPVPRGSLSGGLRSRMRLRRTAARAQARELAAVWFYRLTAPRTRRTRQAR